MLQPQQIINITKAWIEKVIIEFNFCPFARKEFVDNRIHYQVVENANTQQQLESFATELKRLDDNPQISTSLLIYPIGLESFFDYLDLLQLANQLLIELNYEGVYQIASFHPDYCFEDTQQNDPANYTNRSPFAVFHLLREQQLEQALASYPDPELIPEHNIETARSLGTDTLKALTQSLINHYSNSNCER
jgi:uncharacterized protein